MTKEKPMLRQSKIIAKQVDNFYQLSLQNTKRVRDVNNR